ncbi:MAG: holin [Clostridia bacterium]|nr:holin [Clostridia bacterium]
MEQNRLLSPVVWSAIAAQLLAILVTLGVISTGVSEAIDGLVASLLQLLVAFGVLNNPTSKTSF